MPHRVPAGAGRVRPLVGPRRGHRRRVHGQLFKGRRARHLQRVHQQLLARHRPRQTGEQAQISVRRLSQSTYLLYQSLINYNCIFFIGETVFIPRPAVLFRFDGETRSEIPAVHSAASGDFH